MKPNSVKVVRFFYFHKIRTFVAPGIIRPGFCNMDATTIVVLMLMFSAAAFYVVRKYGNRFKK